MLAVTVYGDDGKTAIDWRLCLVPKSDYEIIDTWYAMGMEATGSKDIAVTELFVPERRALPLPLCRGGLDHPGAALSTGPLYRIPIVAAAPPAWRRRRSARPRAPTSCSGVDGQAHRHLHRRQGRRLPGGADQNRPRPLPDRFGRAISAPVGIEFQSSAARNEVPDLATKLRFRAQSAFAVNQAREAVETLWSCYGAQGLYTRDPLQRHLRDVIAMGQHFSFNFDIAGSAFGLHALGGTYANPTM